MFAIYSAYGKAYDGFVNQDSAEEAMTLVQAVAPDVLFWVDYSR
jgi:hypothetical protein